MTICERSLRGEIISDLRVNFGKSFHKIVCLLIDCLKVFSTCNNLLGAVFMKGIVGWVDVNNNFSEENVIKMANVFSGSYEKNNSGMYKSNNVRLINRIFSAYGEDRYIQPMTLEKPGAGKFTVIYMGNIFNKEEIEEKLLRQGIKIHSKNESELILKSFFKWEKDFLDEINGVFSIAIWSDLKKELFLARDKIGVKSLFFYEYETGIIFSSQLRILLSNAKVKPLIDENSLKEIFFIGPGRTPGNGIIKGVKELLPGEYATFNFKNKLKRHTYWKLKAKEFTDSFSVSVEKTRFLIEDSIKRQINTKEPLCCLLSGGLDSSVVSKVISDNLKCKNLEPLTTYSVDYYNNEKYFKKNVFQPTEDKDFINTMVDYIKSRHKMITLSNGNLANALYEATIARSLPGMADIDSSFLLLCKEIKKDFDVAFSGECADELFGGYPWYHNKDVLFKETFPWSSSLKIRKSILKKGLLKDVDDYVYQRYKKTVDNTDKLPNETKLSSRMREMFTLNLNWFMRTLLERGECMSAYSGLDLKVPFCDYRIVEYAYNMPWEIKALNGREKGIVREAMKGILPEKIVLRKKSPYPKTYNPIFMNAVCAKVKEILTDRTSLLSNILEEKSVLSLMQLQNQDEVEPWYGQLMKIPQIMAYIIQIDCWLKKFKIKLV